MLEKEKHNVREVNWETNIENVDQIYLIQLLMLVKMFIKILKY